MVAMSDEDLKLTPELMETLRQIPQSTIAVTRMGTCLCGKLLDIAQWERKWHSGRWYQGKQVAPGINYAALLCADCEKEFRGAPRIVCLGCKALMGFYKHGRQQTGFVFEKNRHYHIVDCPKCNTERNSTPVIEHEKFCRDHGIKTTTNHDLLQEIEQKILQGEREAAKLRLEFEASRAK